MLSFLRRYRWWLLGACVVFAGLASWCFWPEPAGRVMRERYDRVRIGMTEVDVRQIMGGGPNLWLPEIYNPDRWRCLGGEPNLTSTVPFGGPLAYWGDDSIVIYFAFSDGELMEKSLWVPTTHLEMKAREWFHWLGL